MHTRVWIGLIAASLLGAAGIVALAQPRAGHTGRMGFSAGAPAGGDAAHGRRLTDASCAACHGSAGDNTNPQYPKLAGQTPAYLYKQLLDFKSGARRSSVMQGFVTSLSQADMADLAVYFSAQPTRPDRVPDKRLAAEGERIYRSPGPASPSCATCHGGTSYGGMGAGHMGGMGHMAMMRGMGPAPVLDGQHAAYTVSQLDAFQSGARESTVMGRIAAALSSADKRAVAEYIAGRR